MSYLTVCSHSSSDFVKYYTILTYHLLSSGYHIIFNDSIPRPDLWPVTTWLISFIAHYVCPLQKLRGERDKTCTHTQLCSPNTSFFLSGQRVLQLQHQHHKVSTRDGLHLFSIMLSIVIQWKSKRLLLETKNKQTKKKSETRFYYASSYTAV